jgi:dihydrofolate reductase
MRQVRLSAAVSLDNFIARADQSYDWLIWSDESAALLSEFWRSVDTVLMGRKTYEVAAASGHGGSGRGISTYVFSRTLPDVPGVDIVREDAAGFVRELKGRPGKDIFLMGGGELARSLFEAGLVDEIGFNIHPLLLGSGVPMFLPMTRQIDLERLDCRPFGNGCVAVRYRVRH